MGIGTLLIRTDATPDIGTGHVMRCLALAEAWQERGGHAVFATHRCVPGIQQRLTSANIEVHDLSSSPGSRNDSDETGALIDALRPEWVVIDGFGFTSDYASRLQRLGTRIALIDDHGTRDRYDADVVINPNIFASAEMYPRKDPATELLVGLRFALIRREFRKIERSSQHLRSKRNLLVTLGGSDPDNVTLAVLEALDTIAAQDFEITVICGAANEHSATLEGAARRLRKPVRLLKNVRDMGEVLACADMAISAPGASATEFAAVGVPVLLITMAENHARTGEEFAARGFAVSLGWWNQMTVAELAAHLKAFLKDDAGRARKSELAAQHIDTFGADRIVERLTTVKLEATA
ncbi:MAG TPA: UDP-2,4-diacetamido-2,4,6-trideoxy-beta-L-altropyranose hydrolase [Terriglobales bacterium]|nr:UDP-2,4-diacetamido-2,4,6-trideoxy-beta-L-altropyranose hydrolase [Terriglobales bacterium]